MLNRQKCAGNKIDTLLHSFTNWYYHYLRHLSSMAITPYTPNFFLLFDVTGSPLVVFPQSTNFWHSASMIAFDDLPHFFFSILKIPKPSSSLSHFLISPFCTSNHQLFCFSFIKQLSQYLVWLINGNGDTRATDIFLSSNRNNNNKGTPNIPEKKKKDGDGKAEALLMMMIVVVVGWGTKSYLLVTKKREESW